eukprot:1139323-Pelagomonas_calceolata.AAC.1
MASGVIAMSKAHGTSCGSDSQEYIVGARPWYMTQNPVARAPEEQSECLNALRSATRCSGWHRSAAHNHGNFTVAIENPPLINGWKPYGNRIFFAHHTDSFVEEGGITDVLLTTAAGAEYNQTQIGFAETKKKNAIKNQFHVSDARFGSGNPGRPCRNKEAERNPQSSFVCQMLKWFRKYSNPDRPCRGKKTSRPRSTSLANPD